jgi:rhodanese-related sulfurtransferase
MSRKEEEEENERRRRAIEATVSKFTDDSVPTLTVRDVLNIDREKTNVVFLDCREKDEREVAVIPGAVSASDFSAADGERDGGKETIVIAYCTIGYRSQKKVMELKKNYPKLKAYNLKGSIVAWTHEPDAPKLVLPSGEETNRVHTYGKTWALQRTDYISVVHKVPLLNVVKGLFARNKK